MSATINSSLSPEQNPCGELNDPGKPPSFPNLEKRDILFGGSENCSGGGDDPEPKICDRKVSVQTQEI